jgi:hypothetical protein
MKRSNLLGDPAESRRRAEARGIDTRFHEGGTAAGRRERAAYRRLAPELTRHGMPTLIHEIGTKSPTDVVDTVAAIARGAR